MVIDGWTRALRNVHNKCHPGKSIHAILAAEKHKITPLKGKVINQTQWDVLYPTPPNTPDINKFDITLLSILFRNICCLTAPATSWGQMLNAKDLSDQANIVGVRLFCNEIHAHIPETDYWKKISLVLVRLRVDQLEIDKLKVEECGGEVVQRVISEWNTKEDDIKEDHKRIEMEQKEIRKLIEGSWKEVEKELKDIKQMITDLHGDYERFKPSEEMRMGQVLRNHVSCDFISERKIFCNKSVKGTRNWVFRQVQDWFNN